VWFYWEWIDGWRQFCVWNNYQVFRKNIKSVFSSFFGFSFGRSAHPCARARNSIKSTATFFISTSFFFLFLTSIISICHFSSRVFIFSPSICHFFFHFEGGGGYSTLLLYNTHTHTHAHTSTSGCGGESGEEAAEMLCAFFILVVYR
jgi:hypothetical protein